MAISLVFHVEKDVRDISGWACSWKWLGYGSGGLVCWA